MTDVDSTALKNALEDGYIIFYDDSDGIAVQVVKIMKFNPREGFNRTDEVAIFAVYSDGEIGDLKMEDITKFKIYKRIHIEQIRHHPDFGGFK